MFPNEEARREADKCSSCGFCLAACPVYQSQGIETLGARGRIDAIRGLLRGELELTQRMEDVLSTCLLCKACQDSCPSGVRADKVILQGRHLAVQKGLPVLQWWAFRRFLKDRAALGRALRLVSIVQGLNCGRQAGTLRHLPALVSGLTSGRALPPIAKAPLRHRLPVRTPAPPRVTPRGRVALFAGCFLEFVDTPLGFRASRVLASQGFEALYPPDQVCCGAPVLYTGDLEDAMELALMNARAFAQLDVEAVLTLCATCGSALREGYRSLAAHLDAGDRQQVLGLSDLVQDISQFLTQRGPLLGLSTDVPLSVTYHDPCHHARGQVIVTEEPRELLRGIPGVQLVEMGQPSRCCGGGGAFSLTHAQISLEIGRWKIRDILATGAQAVATACPGCMLQIQDLAAREHAALEVWHVVDLIDRALADPSEIQPSNSAFQPVMKRRWQLGQIK